MLRVRFYGARAVQYPHMMKIPFLGVVKNIVAIPFYILVSLFVLMFFYYFFLFFAYDLSPDFIQQNQCDRYDGTWNGETKTCKLEAY